MKLRSIILGVLAVSLFAFNTIVNNADPKEKESAILDAVIKYLEILHFDPKDIDDTFSEQLHYSYIKNLDSGKRFLLQSEIDQLAASKLLLDDQIVSRTFEYFNLSVDLINTAIDRGEKMLNELIEEGININDEGTLQMDYDKRPWATNEDDLRLKWRQTIQYDLVGKLQQKIKDQEKDTSLTEMKTVEELQVDAIADTKKTYDDWFKRLKKVRRSDRFENYINSITHLYDPHTDYYNPKEKEDFDIRMGGKLEGIGARLTPDGDYIKVSSLIPGGPAWKGKELEVNDVIYSVRQENEEIAMEIQGMMMDDVVSKIRGDKGTKVTLQVKSADGSFKYVTIERDEVIIDEGFARSAILDIPDVSDNIGYILLPKFYSSFEGKMGNSCSKDIAKEIEKLKTENVNGIILDLRNNGGGSLQDVISMSGLFIEEGPIVQVKARERDAYVYSDKDASVQYDGPLIVMVNQFSASASEILAAALQDYKRAVIIGSPATFGKGTVQRFENLDKYIQGNNNLKPLGQIKLTMQKFYRINGGSTQLNGVNPDIVLPDPYKYLEAGEKEYDTPLAWTEIDAVDYNQDVFQIRSIDALRNSSLKRIENNSTFQLIEENAKRLKKNKDENTVPIDFNSYQSFVSEKELESKKFEDMMESDIDHLVIKNLNEDIEYINSDESRQARNEDWLKNMQKDVYIEEAMHIMKDLKEKV